MTRSRTEAINSYITDMLSLEEHIAKAIKGQIEDLDESHPDVSRVLATIDGSIQRHIRTLETLSDQRKAAGKGVAEAVKRAGSAVAGLGAAAIDFVRNETLPKDLRDDYTALSLASIGYVMLHTTALSLDDPEVADVARSHLADHAQAVMLLHNVIPSAVIRFLREDGLPAREEVLPEVAHTLESVWRQGARQVPDAAAAAVSTQPTR
jgi:hypothetical protein